jgi:hypothetical protein
MGSEVWYIFLNGRWKLTFSRTFIRRELTQFIRKTGLKTTQLQSEDRTIREVCSTIPHNFGTLTVQLKGRNPQTTRVHRLNNSGGLDWDINHHHTTQLKRLGGLDWDINAHSSRQLKTTLLNSARSDWDIDTSQHTPLPQTGTPLLLYSVFFSFCFFNKEKENKPKGKEEEALT